MSSHFGSWNWKRQTWTWRSEVPDQEVMFKYRHNCKRIRKEKQMPEFFTRSNVPVKCAKGEKLESFLNNTKRASWTLRVPKCHICYQFPRWTARNDSWDPRTRESQAHQQMLCFSLSRTLTFGEWWYLGISRLRCPTKPQGTPGRAFPGFQPRGISQCQPQASWCCSLHTHPLFRATRAVSTDLPQHEPPVPRRHSRWWTSYTWCSLGASSEWAVLCGHRLLKRGGAGRVSVTWKPSSIIRGKRKGDGVHFFPLFVFINFNCL